jgi:hypothetical protein
MRDEWLPVLVVMRQPTSRQQARVKAVKEKRGFEAAIRVARGLAADS